MKQQSFLPKLKIHTRLDHGGDVRPRKRKLARPFDPKRPLHLVFRSTKARGKLSLLTPRNDQLVKQLLNHFSQLYQIKVYRFQNVGNHIQLLVQTKSRGRLQARKDLSSFLRRFAGELAMKVTNSKKGMGAGGFWDRLVYSRIVSWGREYETIVDYFTKNFFEAAGLKHLLSALRPLRSQDTG